MTKATKRTCELGIISSTVKNIPDIISNITPAKKYNPNMIFAIRSR